MGFFDEIKNDAIKSGAMIGALLGFVVLFFMWSISIWLLVGVLIIAGGGLLAWKYYR